MYMLFLVTQTSYSHMDCSPPGSSVHENSPVKNTGAGYHAPGDLPNPGIEPRSPALQADSLPSEPPGNPKNTVAYPFSRGSSWLRNWTRVSCLADGFFTNWAIREAQTGVGSHSLLQGIFPTQGMNSGLLHCRQILYCLNHQKSPEGPCIYICIYTHTHIYIYIYICLCVCTYIHIKDRVSLHMHIHMCTFIYIYTFICIQVFTYIQKYNFFFRKNGWMLPPSPFTMWPYYSLFFSFLLNQDYLTQIQIRPLTSFLTSAKFTCLYKASVSPSIKWRLKATSSHKDLMEIISNNLYKMLSIIPGT